MSSTTNFQHIFKIVRKVFFTTLLVLLSILIVVILILQIPAVQSWTAAKTVQFLSKKLETKVTLEKVDINVFDHVELKGFYVEDQQGDTLLYCENLAIGIRNINPFKPAFRLRNIELHNARVNIYRKNPDTVFNYQFAIDAFASSDTSTSESSSIVDLNFKKVVLEKVHFSMYDDLEFTSSDYYLESGEILANKINTQTGILGFESIRLTGADVKLTNLLDTIPEVFDPSDTIPNYDYVSIALGKWIIEANAIQLENCSLVYINNNKNDESTAINFDDLDLREINLDFEQFIYAGDTITTFINGLSLKEKSGFTLNKLTGKTLFSGNEITINNLLLETPNSVIRDSLSLTYSTLNDFDRLYDDVRFEANLNDTKLQIKDLAYFSSSLAKYDGELLINGIVKGPISNLRIKQLNANLNGAIAVVGDIKIKGLPSVDHLFIDADFKPLNIRTTQLGQINIKTSEQIQNLGDVMFVGKFTGFISDFVLYGDIATSIGKVKADFNFKNITQAKIAQYSGRISTTNLNIGKLLSDSTFGNLSTTASFSGNGLTLATLNAKVEATITDAEINNYNYNNVTINGTVSDKFFEGNLSVADTNANFEFSGKIDLNSEIHKYDFYADVKNIDLYTLHLYDQPFSFTTEMNVNLAGNELNNIDGTTNINNTKITTQLGEEIIDSISIIASSDNFKHVLEIKSDSINATLNGNFNLNTFGNSLKNMFAYFINGEVREITATDTEQQLDFEITTGDLTPIVHLIYPALDSFSNIKISGSLNTDKYEMFARVQAKNIKYGGKAFRNLAIEVVSDKEELNFFGKVKEIAMTETYTVPQTVLEGNFKNKTIDFNLKMGKDTDPERLNLTSTMVLDDSLISLNILPSEIYINNERWDIETNNTLKYDYKTVQAQNFTLRNGERTVSLTSENDAKTGNLLKLEIQKFNISDLSTLAGYDTTVFKGILNAKLNIAGDFSNPDIIALATVDNLYIYNQKIGNVNLTASMIDPNPNLQFNLILRGDNSMRGYGYYHRGEIDSLNLVMDIGKVPLKVLEPFTQGLFSDFDGDMYGNVTVKGPLSKLDMKGVLEMKNGGMKFDYLGVKYHFNFQKIEIEPNKIYLTPNQIFDKYENMGYISGNITHDHFSNWNFQDFNFNSGYILIMETTSKENKDFWGYALGKVDMSINGPLENLQVDIQATPARYEDKLSTVYIPAYGSGNIKKNDFIEFVNLKDTSFTLADNEFSEKQLVKINMGLEITPDAEVRIMLNSGGTDVIRGRGTGSLNVSADSKGKVEISGLLKINEGSYDFSFEGLTTKSFTVREGGTILFDRDPLKASLNLVAVYTAERVTKYNLISDMPLTSQQIEEANKAVTVEVLIKIQGSLESPEITFDINVPDEKSGGLSEFETRLNEVKSDPNELNKQVFGLLMLNQFLPKEFGAATAIGGSISNSMTDFITNQLSNYFSDWISEIFPNAEIDVGYRKVSNSSDLSSYETSELELGLKQKLFDNALVVTIGGVYSYENTSASNSSAGLAGDFEVEYKITADGRVRVKAFRRSEYNLISAKNDTRTGIGLIYSKDFDSFRELFERKKKE